MKPSRDRWICSGLNRLVIVPAVVAATMLLASTASAQLYTNTTTSGSANWNTARWSSNVNGPYTSAWTPGADTSFASGQDYLFNRLSAGAAVTLGNVTTGSNTTISFNISTTSSIMEFGGNVRTFDIGQNSVANFGLITLQDTGASANGLIKTGAGTLVMGGGSYTGGLTLNNGVLVATGTNTFGQGAFTINGGTIGSSMGIASFTPVAAAGRSAITVNGDFQLGLAGAVGGNNAAINYNFSGAGNNFDLNAGTRKITVGTSGTAILSNSISNGSLVLAQTDGGTGSFRLSGANSMTSTEIRGSTVNVITSASVLGSGTVTLSGTSAATLNIQGLTLANNFAIASSAGTKTIAQAGIINSTITGTITNSDNTGGLTLGALATKTLTVGSIDGTGTTGVNFGSAALNGTVILNGPTSFAGDTKIDSSTLRMGADNVLATGAGKGNIVFRGSGSSVLDLRGTTQQVNGLDDTVLAGTIQSTVGTLSTLIVGDNNTTSSFRGTISNNTALRKIGSGTLTLSGNNSYTAGTTLTGGVFALGSANAIGTTGTISFGGGTLQYSANNATDYSARFSNAASQQYSIDTNGRNVTLATALTSLGGSFTKLGSGTLTLSGSNTYNNGTTVSAGALVGTAVSLQGNITNNASVVFNQAQLASGTYSGVMSGTGSLTKAGNGSLKIGANQTFTGATNVIGGTLNLAGNLASGTTTIANTATLIGSGTMTGILLVEGSLKPGESASGSLRAAGITLEDSLSDTTMSIAGTGPGSGTAGINYDTVIANSGLKYGGPLTINFDTSTVYANGTSFSLFQAASFDTSANPDGRGFASLTAAGNAPYSGLTFSYSPADAGTPGRWLSSQTGANQYLVFLPSTGTLVIVPEPSTWAMTLASVGFAGWMARRKKLARKRRMA
jgi:autotransporter-associated beta strand protein